MNWISNLFSKHWRNIHLALIAALCIVLILARRDVNPDICGAVKYVLYQPFEFIKDRVRLLRDAALRNDSLRLELAETALELTLCNEKSVKNNRLGAAEERLRAASESDSSFHYRLTPVRVALVYFGGHHLPITADIYRSEGDSIFVGQPIIDQNGLVGRVESFTDDRVTVQLLTHPSNRVAARVSSSGEMGIVKFLPSRTMILDNFLSRGTIKEDDTVLSSGLGGDYPAGLIVGTVTKVFRSENEPFCWVELRPAANFRSLEALFLLNAEQR